MGVSETSFLYGSVIRALFHLLSLSICFPQFLVTHSQSGFYHRQEQTGLRGPIQGHPYRNLLDQHLCLNPGKDSNWSAWVLDPPLDQSLCPRKWSTLIGQLTSVPAFVWEIDRPIGPKEQGCVAIPRNRSWMIERKNNLSTTLRFLNLIFPIPSKISNIISGLSRKIKVKKKKLRTSPRIRESSSLLPAHPSFHPIIS